MATYDTNKLTRADKLVRSLQDIVDKKYAELEKKIEGAAGGGSEINVATDEELEAMLKEVFSN